MVSLTPCLANCYVSIVLFLHTFSLYSLAAKCKVMIQNWDHILTKIIMLCMHYWNLSLLRQNCCHHTKLVKFVLSKCDCKSKSFVHEYAVWIWLFYTYKSRSQSHRQKICTISRFQMLINIKICSTLLPTVPTNYTKCMTSAPSSSSAKNIMIHNSNYIESNFKLLRSISTQKTQIDY